MHGKQINFNQQKRGVMTQYKLKYDFVTHYLNILEKIIQIREFVAKFAYSVLNEALCCD